MIYGQHFMIDEKVLEKISKLIKKNSLEIGGGHGALSELIKPKKIIEIDSRLAKELKEKGFNVINKDALKVDLDNDFIVGNISYEIAEPLMNKLVKTKFKEAILCVPKRFAYGLKGRNTLGLIMPKLFKIENLFDVKKDSFDPKPKVNSEVIRIKPKKLSKKAEVLRELYLQQDKKIKNAFREASCRIYKKSKKQVKIPEFDFLNKKIYQLNYTEWKQLVDKI